MVYAKLFSYRRKFPDYIWTTESKNFVLFLKEISLYYNWKLPTRNLMVCEKLFSLRQRFSHFIWTIEGKNFYVPITYPQYYWKVSIALRGCLEKFFILLLQLKTFTVKLSILLTKVHMKCIIKNLLKKCSFLAAL